MSLDRDVNINLHVNEDPQLQQKLNRTTGALNAELTKVGKNTALENLAGDADRLAKSTERASQSAQKLAQNVGRAQTPGGAPVSATVPAPAGGGAGASQAAGAIGAGVGLAGSLGGSAGLGQAGSALGLLGSNLSALGPAGVIAAGAAVGLGLAMKELSKASESARKEMEAYLQSAFAEIDARGQTTDAIQKQIEEQTKAAENAREKSALAQEAYDEAFNRFRAGSEDNFRAIGDFLGIWSDQVNVAKEALDEENAKAQEAQATLEGLTAALDSTETAAADTKKAMEELAQQMTDDLLDSASDAGDAVRQLAAAQERSRDANVERLKQIAVEQKATETELQQLRESGNTSADVTKRIEALNSKLNDLGQEADIVSGVMSKQASAQREVAASAQKTTQAAQSVGMRLFAVSKQQKDTLDEQLKAMIEFGNKIADIEYDAAKQREKIAIDANREQERLIRESKQQFDQDFYQDFLGEFQRRQQLAFNLRETQIGAQQSFADVGRESFNTQQQLRAQTPGAQPMNNTFNITGDTQSIMRTLQQAGVVR